LLRLRFEEVPNRRDEIRERGDLLIAQCALERWHAVGDDAVLDHFLDLIAGLCVPQ